MVVSLAFAGIGRGFTAVSQEASIAALARYAVARYAGYVTFCLGFHNTIIGLLRATSTSACVHMSTTSVCSSPEHA